MPWVAAAIAASAVVGAAASRSAANKQADAASQASANQMAMFNQTQSNLAPWMDAGNISLQELQRLSGMAAPDGLKRPTMEDAKNEHLNEHIKRFGSGYTKYSDAGAQQVQTKQIYDRMMKEYEAQVAATPKSQVPDPMKSPLLKPFGMEDFKESPAYQFNLQQGQKAIEKAAAKRGNFYAPATLQDISKFSQGMASNEFQNAYGNYNTNMKNIWDRLYSLSGSGQNAGANLGGFGTTVAGQIGENTIGAGNANAAGQMGVANSLAGGANSFMNYNLMNQMLQSNQQSSVAPRRPMPGLTGAGDLNQNYV